MLGSVHMLFSPLKNKDYTEAKHCITLFPGVCKVPSTTGELPLHYAIREEAPLELIELLIVEYPEALELKSGTNREYPLSLALSSSTNQYSSVFLSRLINVSSVSFGCFNFLGEPPLLSAINCTAIIDENSRLMIIQRMLEVNSSSIKYEDEMGNMALHHAIKSGASVAVIKILYVADRSVKDVEDGDCELLEYDWDSLEG